MAESNLESLKHWSGEPNQEISTDTSHDFPKDDISKKEKEDESEESDNSLPDLEWNLSPKDLLRDVIQIGKSRGSGDVTSSTVHCFNTLRTILEDRTVGGSASRVSLSRSLLVSLSAYDSKQWAIQNSATLLFRFACVNAADSTLCVFVLVCLCACVFVCLFARKILCLRI